MSEDKNTERRGGGRYSRRTRRKFYYFKAWVAGLGPKKLTLLAAGAVLVTAACAVAVGIFLFGDVSRIAQTFRAIAENRTWVFLFLILLIADAVLVFTPTKK